MTKRSGMLLQETVTVLYAYYIKITGMVMIASLILVNLELLRIFQDFIKYNEKYPYLTSTM